MRFLFTTVQGFESEFYARVGRLLAGYGHEAVHLTYSRRAGRLLRESGLEAHSLKARLAELASTDLAAEGARIEADYECSLEQVYRGDPVCDARSQSWSRERSVRQFVAIERLFDELAPDVLVPEVGCELIRTVSHLVARERGIPTLFLFYTIFPRPLRLYVDTMHAPIVPPAELRELSESERQEVERFRREFTQRGEPIRSHRRLGLTQRRLRRLTTYVGARVGEDRDNEYLRPGRWLGQVTLELPRRLAARSYYADLEPGRPFVYFPLHVTDDYKIKRLIPHCADQAAIVEQIAEALPSGHELVLKEHPLSIGRNRVSFLRKLSAKPNVRLVAPSVSSHELIQRAAAVAVISSTVGLEALLYGKPVLTLGEPFYAGYGITLDPDSLDQIPKGVSELLCFRPDPEQIDRFLHVAMRHCYAGVPVLVDDSDENAQALAETLDTVVGELVPRDASVAASRR